jgi:hypothetical protein
MSKVTKIDLTTLTLKQKNAVRHLQNAIWSLQRAQEFSKAALSGSDVGDEYEEEINILIESMSLDLDAIASGEVYEFIT